MHKNDSPTLIGASSLLVMFAVLCLTVFALLSLSTVQADGRLCRATAENVAAYYDADCAAEEIFAALRSGETPAGVEATDNMYSYTCPISQTQELRVELSAENDRWTVLRWQSVSTAEWSAEDDLPVWTGD